MHPAQYAAPAPARLAPDEAGRLAHDWLASYGAATREAYARDLRAWAAHLDAEGIDPLAATRGDVDTWHRDMEHAGLSAATRARRLAAVTSFYRYAEDDGLIERNPAARARRPRVSDESPREGADRAQLAAMLDTARDRSPRDHALVALLALVGLRVSEAVSLDVADLGERHGHRTLTVTRKGGRRQTLALPPRAVAAIADTLGDRTDGPILLARTGGRLSRRSAGHVIGQLAETAQIGHRCPHDMRHAHVTIALAAGVDVHRVADSVGHRNVQTTLRYNRLRGQLDGAAAYAVAGAVA